MNDLEVNVPIDRLRMQYRDLVLSYFQTDPDRKVENFVKDGFDANLSVGQLIIIHSELMEDLTRQLRLEGRNPDILLDYRITLIDVLAHLCERYRLRLATDGATIYDPARGD